MKAVAVPYVIALILGVIAIGLLGYWFISQGGRTVAAGERSECDGKQFTYCLQRRYSSTPPTFGLGTTCPVPDITTCKNLLNLDCVSKTGSPLKCSAETTEYPGFPDDSKCCKEKT